MIHNFMKNIILLFIILISIILVGCNQTAPGIVVGDEIKKSTDSLFSCGDGTCNSGESAYTCPDCGLYQGQPMISQKDCAGQGGSIITLESSQGCSKSTDFLGTIDDLQGPNICCKN